MMMLRDKHLSISDRLRARSIEDPNTGCILWLAGRTQYGYGTLSTDRAGPKKVEYAHRLAYELRHGEIPKGLHICHRCDIPQCINAEHLFAGTAADNIGDASRKGRFPTGRRRSDVNPNRRLSRSKVLQIRKLLAAGETGPAIAKRFGVNHTAIYSIKNKHTWRWA